MTDVQTVSPRSHFDSYERRALLPAIGSTWTWEPAKPHATESVRVEEVRWNGEEWWVRTHSESGDYWNDLSRFWEACVPTPDPNAIAVGETISWHGRPAFAPDLPSGWRNTTARTRHWQRVGKDQWRRID